MLLPAIAAALAVEPWADPVGWRLTSEARACGARVLLGDGEIAPWEREELVAPACGEDVRAAAWMPGEGMRGEGLAWSARPFVGIVGGDDVSLDAGGDTEPGLVTLVARGDAALYAGPLVLWAAPELELGAGGGTAPTGVDRGCPNDDPACAAARLDGAWVGLDARGWAVGVGKRERWFGPGRHGAIVRSTHARAPGTGALSAEGALPGRAAAAGIFRGEVELGVLDRPRHDVARPGLLAMDLRWSPVSVLEIGLARMAIFGGEDRPPVDWLQLAVPTEPHVYDDPDKLLPDQNELAAVDVRVTLPLEKWTGGPVRWVEGWWQYGGEDVIARKLGAVPYPSLAGVGNLYGAEVAVGPVVVTGEYTRLMDDTFRWYVGHRVYHDGFTQDGRVLGHWGGPDSETAYGAVAWEGEALRARLYMDHRRRVGVVEALNGKVFTLSEEERTTRAGLDGSAWIGVTTRFDAGVSVARTRGAGFVPDAQDLDVRLYAGLSRAFGGRTTSDPRMLDRRERAP